MQQREPPQSDDHRREFKGNRGDTEDSIVTVIKSDLFYFYFSVVTAAQ